MYKGKHASNRVISVILALSPWYTDAKKGTNQIQVTF